MTNQDGPEQDAGQADVDHQWFYCLQHQRAGVATDIVERLVEDTIQADARVLFVPDGTLPAGGGVAVLRY